MNKKSQNNKVLSGSCYRSRLQCPNSLSTKNKKTKLNNLNIQGNNKNNLKLKGHPKPLYS